MGRPLVSIVTPCLNAERYIGQTVASVLEQDYADLEYVVMDGGSTDRTLEILAGYEGRLTVTSQQDKGQADAINRGFDLTRGEIFAFLNADDTYVPGAIARAVSAFADSADAAVVYGDAWHTDERGRAISRYPVEPFDPARLSRRCFICQPAAFVRRDAFAGCGKLDARLHFGIDYDLWIRLARRHRFVKIDSFLANSRLHPAAKTVGQTSAALKETMEILERHYGYVPYNWIYGYAYHLLSGKPIAAEAPRPSVWSAGYSLALGLRYNWRSPIRYCLDVLATAREGIA
jgi:glycosyltransferase involved in cell wall biosynthesis